MSSQSYQIDLNFKSNFDSETQKINKGISGIGTAMKGIIGLAIFDKIKDVFVNLGKSILDTTVEFEKYNAVLTNLFDSQEKATQAQEAITLWATKTPFAINESIDAYQKLVSRGLAPTEEAFTAFGDIASSQGKSLDQFTEAVLDATSGEFERLKEFGIKAKQNGDKVTFTFKGQTETIKKNGDAIENYLIKIGKMKGVQGSMEGQMKTLGGAISNMKDKFILLSQKIGSELSPVLQPLILKFTEFAEKITPKIIQGVQFLVKLFSNDLPSAFRSIWSVMQPFFNKVVSTINTVIGGIISIVNTIRTGFTNAFKNINSFKGYVSGIGDVFMNVADVVSGVVTFIAGAFSSIIKFFTENKIGIKIANFIYKPIKWVTDKIGDLFGWLAEKLNELNKWLGFDNPTINIGGKSDTSAVPESKVESTKKMGLDDLSSYIRGGNKSSGGSGNVSNAALGGSNTGASSGVKNISITVDKQIESVYISQNENPMIIKDLVQKALTQLILDAKLAI